MNTGYPMNDRRFQRGAVTLAIGILLLLLITLIALYGARVGLVEQRIAGNDYRIRLAHGAAEAGRNNAVEFLNAHLQVFNSDEAQIFLDDGSTVSGWLSAGNDRWGNPVVLDCASPAAGHETAACNSGMSGSVYYYRNPNDPSGGIEAFDIFPVGDFSSDRVAVNADRQGNELQVSYNADFVLCPLDIDGDPPTLQNPPCTADIEDAQYFAVLVRSDGFIIGDPDGTGVQRLDQEGEAEINEIVIKYDLFGAGPKVPLTVAASFGAGGTFDIVANPNGGPPAPGGAGSGAPFSVWSGGDYDLGGATVTCQRYEFMATRPGSNQMFSNTPPNDVYEVCYDCTCPNKQNEQFYYLSSDVKVWNYDPAEPTEGPDIVDSDPNFPSDLFKFTFGVPREDYTILKDLATQIPRDIATCDGLNTDSSGLYWSETACDINNNVGTPHNPALIISEGDVRVNGGAVVFGVIYVFAPPGSGASPGLALNGGAQIYGAVVADTPGSGAGAGGNVIIYDQAVLNRLSLHPDIQRVSPLPGTWTDRAAP